MMWGYFIKYGCKLYYWTEHFANYLPCNRFILFIYFFVFAVISLVKVAIVWHPFGQLWDIWPLLQINQPTEFLKYLMPKKNRLFSFYVLKMAFLLSCITDIFFRLESCFKDWQFVFKEMASLRGLYFHITSPPLLFLSHPLKKKLWVIPPPTKVTFDSNQKRLTMLKNSF